MNQLFPQTFVCPTEIIAHDKRIDEFRKRDVEVVGVSIDSQFTEKYGEVCPAGWQKEDKGMKATADGVAEFLATHSNEL